MDHRDEVADFLRSRRDRLTLEQAGLVAGGRRRVPGLRREEVALLAGISVDYYAKMERGDLRGVSPEILESVARALHLDDAEVDHLVDLAAASSHLAPTRRKSATPSPVSPNLRRVLDAITEAPAWIRGRRMTIQATNALAGALYRPVLADEVSRGNLARFLFFSPAARAFFPDWEHNADDVVATMRIYAGHNPTDKALTDLVGELVTRSEPFRTRWAAHNVRHHRSGTKRIHHPEVGDLTLHYEGMELPEHPDLFMYVYTAQPGSPSDEGLRLLGSLAAQPAEVAEGQGGARVSR